MDAANTSQDFNDASYVVLYRSAIGKYCLPATRTMLRGITLRRISRRTYRMWPFLLRRTMDENPADPMSS